eukprot:CAMPEP_0177671356 /NCGR_PEP_ID=MMETSP0447-20121125/24655_1 /TAXON_ID=0 /ORGANISM="Stygamoeba regulata, Strain BSH-02190019" /LENGTH=132 /DNA_ID=CAMNT_0019178733 /DNA_START=237 /DNA_END=631 /DNA_ORIENTATION=-
MKRTPFSNREAPVMGNPYWQYIGQEKQGHAITAPHSRVITDRESYWLESFHTILSLIDRAGPCDATPPTRFSYICIPKGWHSRIYTRATQESAAFHASLKPTSTKRKKAPAHPANAYRYPAQRETVPFLEDG